MSQICLKCGLEAKVKVSATASCPKCGAIYAKVSQALAARQKGDEIKRLALEAQSRRHALRRRVTYRLVTVVDWFFTAIGVVLRPVVWFLNRLGFEQSALFRIKNRPPQSEASKRANKLVAAGLITLIALPITAFLSILTSSPKKRGRRVSRRRYRNRNEGGMRVDDDGDGGGG